MARVQNRLSTKGVAALKAAGYHADGGGLYLRIQASGSRSWTFVYQLHGKRRELSLGSPAVVSLAEARDKRDDAKRRLADGFDPAAKTVEASDEAATFGQAADALVGTLEGGWKNAKHRQQWRNTLKTHCESFWNKPVGSVTTADVLSAVSPIWSTTPETAVRLRGRIERVLDAAKVKGQRTGDNPARWRGHLEVILPKRRKKGQVRHHPALPYAEVPKFIVQLKHRVSTAARALEFLILTAARTGEVLGAKWKEIDLEAGLWIVPKERMKMGIEHRVPLTAPAIVVLEAMKVFGDDQEGFIFPGRKVGQKLSNMSMEMLLRRMSVDDFTVHGFRSSFRDWAGEETDHAREVAEAALAHQVGNEVERSYRRGDALAKRRRLMEEWAEYITSNAAG